MEPGDNARCGPPDKRGKERKEEGKRIRKLREARRKMENMTDGFVLHLLGSLPGYLQWDDHPLDHRYDIVRVSPLLADLLVQDLSSIVLQHFHILVEHVPTVDSEGDNTSKGPRININH